MSDDGVHKVVVLGSGGVGKSALTIRLVTDHFLEEYNPTIEDNFQKNTTIDGIPTVIDILDTAGQEEYSSMQDQWMREGNGFLLVYAVNEMATFEEMSQYRMKILRTKGNDKVPIVLVGNKCDVDDHMRQVPTAVAQRLATEWGVPFFESSAKTPLNNEECFYEVVREVRRIRAMAAKAAEQKKPRKFFSFCSIL